MDTSEQLKYQEIIIADLNQVTGKNFKLNSQTSGFINARMDQGYTVEDFKTVHQLMAEQWLPDPKMQMYVRPSTLYRPLNFDNYLNSKQTPLKPDKRVFQGP